MRFNTAVGIAVLAAGAAAKEFAKNEKAAAAIYDNGARHEEIMAKKIAGFEAGLVDGVFDTSVFPRLDYTKCVNGKAAAIPGDPLYTFSCKNTDLYDFRNHADLGSPGFNTHYNQTGSGVWGWTDPDSGREFIAAGLYDGTSLLEVLPTGKLLRLGFLKSPAPTGPNSLWKEVRGYKHYAVIGSELSGHGIQVFDFKKLLNLPKTDTPYIFDGIKDVTGRFTSALPAGRTHNVVVNEELEYGVSTGAATRTGPCKAGLIFFDLKDPSKLEYLGCDGSDGYVHDAQCLVYRGPDTKYFGRDICYGYNEDTLTIYDVTNKNASKIISRTSYEGYAYTHQGWVLNTEWQEYLVMDDEYDEFDKTSTALDGYPVTYIWDIKNLEAPKQVGQYKGTVIGIDHNQYVIGDYVYQSSYQAGLRIYDISSIPTDPSGSSVCEVAYFDIYPEDDHLPGGGTLVDFYGTWASYAYFKSGFIVINTMERGVYVVKTTKKDKCKKTCNADNCLRALRANTIPGRLEESQAFCAEYTKTFVSDVSLVKPYAASACAGNINSRVSSACSCLPKPTGSP